MAIWNDSGASMRRNDWFSGALPSVHRFCLVHDVRHSAWEA
jgi:hypothetical protein